jgi:hypothetical protein
MPGTLRPSRLAACGFSQHPLLPAGLIATTHSFVNLNRRRQLFNP